MLVNKKIGPLKIEFELDTSIKHENLYYSGFYDNEEDLYANILNGYDNPVAFDVGSNIGFMSAIFYSNGATVHAFEPVKAIYEKSLQKLPSDIHVNNFALSNRNGKAKIYVSSVHEQGSTFKEEVKQICSTIFKDDTEIVKLSTLDGYCKTNNIDSIHLLKIDAEGSELDVLKGSRNMLSDKKIKNIVFEAITKDMATKIIKYLSSLGYESSFLDSLNMPMKMYISKPL